MYTLLNTLVNTFCCFIFQYIIENQNLKNITK